MLLTVSKTVNEEIEIGEFPIFTHSSPYYYKIISPNEAVRVHLSDFGGVSAVETLPYETILGNELATGTRIEENMFIDAFVKVVHALNDLVRQCPNVEQLELSKAS